MRARVDQARHVTEAPEPRKSTPEPEPEENGDGAEWADGSFGSLAETLYVAAKDSKTNKKECEAFAKKVRRAERLTAARDVDSVAQPWWELEGVIQQAIHFIYKSQQRGILLSACSLSLARRLRGEAISTTKTSTSNTCRRS